MFESLASSSAGNAYVVSDKETRILLECGISTSKLQKLSGYKLSQFAACFVTHEHKDHAKSVPDLLARGMDIYMSNGTAEALELDESLLNLAHEATHNVPITVGTLEIVPFNTFHDAREPLGYLIKSLIDGDVLVFATDTVNLRYQFPGVTLLAIEANYDKAILDRCEKMPEKVRYRITKSHMEIDTLCDILRHMDLSHCREIYLLHLSDSHSHEQHFVNKVWRAVPKDIRITVCPKTRG